MTTLWAETALLPDGVAAAVRLEIDPQGAIAAVVPGAAPQGAQRLAGLVLPGMPNLHSHAFQRAMAGLAERLAPGEASFWTWREVMYRFLERIGPDELDAIAAQLYVEMLEAGYTAVGEFHYLHHQPDGRPYADPAELSLAILAAQQATGIGLTLLPVLYMAGGFGGGAAGPGPAPFPPRSRRLRAAARAAAARDRGRPRPVRSAWRRTRCARCRTTRCARPSPLLGPDAPVHIHVAEQVKEVRDCLAWCGAAAGRRICSRPRRSAPAGA